MQFLLILAFAAISAAAQTPVVRLTNISRAGSTDFQVGDRFQITITGAPKQTISVRTTMAGRTDWGPLIGETDTNRQWSTTGQFEKADFGDWSETWTVGGKLASPAINFSVSAPCTKGGQGSMMYLGAARAETCETADGTKSFTTPSDADPFRTPDGRVVPGRTRSNMTVEQYRMKVLESLILSDQNDTSSGLHGDEAAALIAKLIGVNALSDREMENAVQIIHAVYKDPQFIPKAAHDPSATLLLLRNFANAAEEASLKQQIAATINYVQLQ